ncbi:MAG TPA: bacillithiol biosynthesis cysteine-adding enzyme BshC [Ignavibacteriaceae bacterium]
MFINFKEIPGNTKLFLDYLYDFEKLKGFYKYNFRDKEQFIAKFKQLSESPKEFRNELSTIINNQYKSFDPSSKTLKNISLLKNKETVAVVTGQQLGILGGPLYTFYKIITAIKLCSHLSERYDNYHFVPVFWLEGDDHDFEEVRSINVLNDNNELIKISYNDEATEEEQNRGSIGHLKLKESIGQFLKDYENQLRNTEFKNPIMENLKSFYTEEKTFKEPFKELLFWLFDQYGLVIFDPQDVKVKELLKPVFKKEINDFRNHTEKLVNISASLEELYHAQVKIRPINLFYNYDEGRYVIEPIENEFRLKGKRKKFTLEELINLIEAEPEKFSPNVLLRPICQDFLFPTGFYIGGPSEVAYFAQILPLYEFYDIDPAIIYPRSSVTILEKTLKSVLEKYGLSVKDIFTDPNKLKNQIINNVSDKNLEEIFKETKNQIDLAFDNLKEKLFELDKTMGDVTSKYRLKVLGYIDELKGKAAEAQKKRYEITLRQIDKASANLFPEMNLQERELSFFHYANKYGVDVLKKIFEELAINKFEHQVIELD